jgi:hypothetical protein
MAGHAVNRFGGFIECTDFKDIIIGNLKELADQGEFFCDVPVRNFRDGTSVVIAWSVKLLE